MIATLLMAAVTLVGFSGEKLKTRAYFDANNVKVGDPLVLTIDFLGNGDFASLHPPALAGEVSRTDWKVDDSSAKTQTSKQLVSDFFSSQEVAVGRTLTYRVRPMREGVLWFPEMEFRYADATGGVRRVRSNAIPVHARAGVDVVVEGMREDYERLPDPDALVTAAPAGLSGDELFAWRKACARPTADAFAEFDFPEAKLNEARMATLAGDWKRALSVYQRLEWRIGQTPAIERGMVAALARRYANPLAELPVWRQVGRPVLKYPWHLRLAIVAGALAAFALVFWLLGRGIRALACVAAALLLALPAAAAGRDPFAEMEAMHRRMQEQMNQMMSQPFGGAFQMGFGGERESAPEVKVTMKPSTASPTVGETVTLEIGLETPRGCTLSQIELSPTETFGMQVVGRPESMTDGKPANPSNVLRRVSFPIRYDVPYRGELGMSVKGMATVRKSRGGRFNYQFSTSFSAESEPVAFEVRPLPGANRPEDFAGLVADSISLSEKTDLMTVGTNDVVTITYRLGYRGFLPEDFMPPGAAFELGRHSDTRSGGVALWRRYFVADGAKATPTVSIPYYDPKSASFKRISAGGTPLKYTPAK